MAESAVDLARDAGGEALASEVSEDIRRELAEKVRSLPPELVLEVALGVEDEYDVAERFGYSKEQYDVLATLKPFQIAVKKTRSDLDKNGDMFRAKARIMAEKVMDSGFARAIDDSTPLKEVTEFLKTLSSLADLAPKTAVTAQGSAFSINIVLPEVDKKTLDVTERAKKAAFAVAEKPVEAVVAIDIPEVKDDEREKDAGAGAVAADAGASRGHGADAGDGGGGA